MGWHSLDLATLLRTLRCRWLGQSDLQRWADLRNLDPAWDERTRLIAGLIPSGSRVIEFGAGRRQLVSYLDKSCIYIASDLVDRGPGTIVIDLNARPLPDLSDLTVDVAVFAGVLEYISDLYSIPAWLGKSVSLCVASYECAHSQPRTLARLREHFRRARAGWVNTYGEAELEALFQSGGFLCVEKTTWHTQEGDERIFVLRRG